MSSPRPAPDHSWEAGRSERIRREAAAEIGKILRRVVYATGENIKAVTIGCEPAKGTYTVHVHPWRKHADPR